MVARWRPQAVSCLLLVSTACTTTHELHGPPAEIEAVADGEGIVFGSLLVELEPERGVLGRDAERFDYCLTLPGPRPEMDMALFHEEWELRVSPGEERAFVGRLPAGRQYAGALRPKPFFSGAFSIPGSFEVAPDAVTYLGRLVLVVPARLGPSSMTAAVRIEDDLTATRAALGSYGTLLDAPRVQLIHLNSDEAWLVSDPPHAPPP